MDIKDILTKLSTISEAPVTDGSGNPVTTTSTGTNPAAGGDDIATIKKYVDNTKGEAFIDSKDGMVKYMDVIGARDTGGTPQPKVMPSDWIQRYAPDLAKALASTGAGQAVKGGPFGMKLDQGTKVDLAKLQQGAAPAGTTTGPKGSSADAVKKLQDLVAKLEASLAVKKESIAEARLVKLTQDNWALVLADGTVSEIPQEDYETVLESIVESDVSISSTLVESFGYAVNEDTRYFYAPNGMLVEYSWDEFKSDAGDFGRGAWNGVTLGAGDNIVAGAKSLFGPGKYKDELAKQTAASKEAEKRSPWLYGAGNVAGSLAMPVPGGAIAGGLIKGATKGAQLARGATALGTNLAAQAGVDKLKQVADTKTLGYDPNKYPTSKPEIMAFQKANGLTPDGIIGPKTKGILDKMGIEPEAPAGAVPSVAESIKSLSEKLAMIESGQWRLEEDADYRVWLLEDGTVVDEEGKVLDNDVFETVAWDSAIDEAWYDALTKGAKAFGRGVVNKTNPQAMGAGGKFLGTTGAEKALNKAGRQVYKGGAAVANTIKKNPIKTALGAGALGLAIGSSGGATAPAGTTTPAGGHSGGSAPAGTTTPDATALTPEQQDLIKQIHDTMNQDFGDDPEWIKATGHAQVVLDKAEHANPAQTAMDQSHDTASTQFSQPAGDAAKDPAKNPNPATSIPGGPQTAAGNTPALTPKATNESDELTRWLRIARGE